MAGRAKIGETKVANIKKLKELGYTVKRIAELTGVSAITVNDYTLPGFYEGRLKRSRDYLRRTVLDTGSTKQEQVRHKHLHKRPYPEGCEICGRSDQRLYYHHWDDSNLSLGVWACFKDHRLAELVDAKGPKAVTGLMITYERLKREIELAGVERGGSSSKSESAS